MNAKVGGIAVHIAARVAAGPARRGDRLARSDRGMSEEATGVGYIT
jgi:hypothetical protein